MDKKIDKRKVSKFIGLLFLLLAFAFPVVTESYWFNIVVKIRTSINTGDSGSLLLASGYTSILFALLSSLLFLAIDEFRLFFEQKLYINILAEQNNEIKSFNIRRSFLSWEQQKNSSKIHYSLIFCEILAFVVLNLIISNVYQIPWEMWTSLIAYVFILILVDDMKLENQIFKTSIVSLHSVSIQKYGGN